jgi:Cu+-exporting ATPase
MILSTHKISPQSELYCYHCGEKCQNSNEKIGDKIFCCDGCRLVFEILNENNLCSYYSFNQSAGISPEQIQFHGSFDFLNQDELRSKLIHFSDGEQAHVTFFVPSIHCTSCIWLLENLQKIESGILSSSVNFPKREVTVIFKEKEVRLSMIAERLAMIGYKPQFNLSDIDENKTQKSDKSAWYKIGVAGFCFGNIMMLSFPEYFSIGDLAGQAALQRTFSWLNLGLALPVLLFASRDFFTSALGALRAKHLNIDLPIAAAILMTFLRSIYEIVSGTGPGYLDSMSGIVFFMLIGRAFQTRTFETLAFDRDYKSYFPIAIKVFTPNGEEQVLASKLRKGMRIEIRNQEIIPADSIIIQGEANIDYSFVTGEANPLAQKIGDIVYAGGRQSGSSIQLEVVKTVDQSYLTQLWNNPAFRKDDAEKQKASLENTINQYFTLSIFFIALASASYWIYMGDINRMMNAVTTILIVACPCILLLASTFTNGNVLRILGANGFFLKNAFVIDKLIRADVLVFDKTGTITFSRNAELVYKGRHLSKSEIEAIYSLSLQSTHPLSRNLSEIYKGNFKRKVVDFKEFPGKGIQGVVYGMSIQLGSSDFTSQSKFQDAANTTRIYLTIDGEDCGFYSLKHQYREDLSTLFLNLRKKYKLYLLSGDHDADRFQLSSWFDQDNMYFKQSPSDKLDFIQNLQAQGLNVLMVGDGLNDAGALQQSNVGIAVSDNLNNFSPACDAILDGSIFQKLNTLLDFCRTGKRVIAFSFGISILYNIVGLWFAVRGELEPIIAAVLMPLTSISIVSLAMLSSSIIARKRNL